MWELDYKESCWAPKNGYFWTIVLEKTLESPLDCKEIQPFHPIGNQSWIFTEGLMLKLQYFGYLMQRTDSLEKTLMLGKIEGRRRRGMTEDEMVGWHHWLNGHEFEQALGIGDGQGSLVCYSPWGLKESDMTERLSWTEMLLCISIKYIKSGCLSFWWYWELLSRSINYLEWQNGDILLSLLHLPAKILL